MSDLKSVIEQSMIQYAGAVLQSRALVDVRDCLKPSARQIFYSMYLQKLVAKNPHKKTASAVGRALENFYIHGDSSCEGIIMHAGQPFSMRYPLIDVKGNCGTLLKSGNWAAMRYTESRLSKLSDLLFADIDKEVISEWRDNYDNTKQYPGVLSCKGFYNIVNGTQGIGIGMASSVPQFNLKEVNAALIHLLWNPNCSFDEIYCAPDFATGATLLNESEVKESLKKGNGSACKLRATIEYDNKEKCLIVTEIPFSVYTNTICKELEQIHETEDNPGIDRFNDLTGKTPLIKIYLNKTANPDQIIKYLYKNTSLQSHYGINMTMLDQGRFPKVFTWKEALQAHLNHEIEVYRKGYEFDLRKIEERIHIIEGLLIALASIDEVVQTIKSSSSTAAAQKKLTENFLLDDVQAKAILDMKLARLARLEVEKLENEKVEKENQKFEIEKILNNKELLYKEIQKGLEQVAEKYGDARRTKILNIESENDEPVEIKKLLVSVTNNNNFYVNEVSSLYIQKKGSIGNKIKLGDKEWIIDSFTCMNNDSILFFSKTGNYYSIKASELPINTLSSLYTVLPIGNDIICAVAVYNKSEENKNIFFITSNGIFKKSKLSEYNTNRKTANKAIKLDEGNYIVSVLICNEEKIGVITKKGKFILCETNTVNPISRVAKGVIGIKLDINDSVAAAKIIGNARELVTISEKGNCKRTELSEFTVSARGGKGVKIQTLSADDYLIDFVPIINETSIIVVSGKSQLKIALNEIKITSKGGAGIKAIKATNKVIGIVK